MKPAEEVAREIVGVCACGPDYRRIRETVNPARVDPGCAWCRFGAEFAAALSAREEEARREERERAADLVRDLAHAHALTAVAVGPPLDVAYFSVGALTTACEKAIRAGGGGR